MKAFKVIHSEIVVIYRTTNLIEGSLQTGFSIYMITFQFVCYLLFILIKTDKLDCLLYTPN